MTSHPRKLRVVKVGGSLLDLEDLLDRVRGWLAAGGQVDNLLVVGGGGAVDEIRRRGQQLSDLDAHWRAIGAMQANTHGLASSLPEAHWVNRLRELPSLEGPLLILDPLTFMRDDDAHHPQGPLPANWSVTSDSIAARAAEMAGALELVLLKSASPPAPATAEALAAVGYVDRFFPEASRRLPRIRYANLRD